MLGATKVDVILSLPDPVLVSKKPPKESPALIVAVEPLATEKLPLPDKLRLPAPLSVQLPLVAPEPKFNPAMLCAPLIVIVLVIAEASPKKTASSPETQDARVVPLRLQKLPVPQVPEPDWKPAAVAVSQVTVAAVALLSPSKPADRRSARVRSMDFRIRFRPTLLGPLLRQKSDFRQTR